MIYQSPSEYKAMQMTLDFLNSLPDKVGGEEFAERLFMLSRNMAHKRIRPEDFNASLTVIRTKYRINDEAWQAVVDHMSRKTLQSAPIIISSEN